MIRRPPRSTRVRSSAASDVYKRQVRSYLVAPLIAKGAVVGTLELTETRRERVFSGDEIGLVEAVCRVAGLAMDNALLIGDLERRNREAELLNEIARRTTASLDLVPIASYSLTLEEHGEFTQMHGSQPSERSRAVSVTGDALGDVLERLQRERVVILDGADDGPVPGGRPAVAGSLSSAAIG